MHWHAQREEDFSAGPWEDEGAAAFYGALPELRALVPALLLGADAVPSSAAAAESAAAPAAPSSQDSAGAAIPEEAPGAEAADAALGLGGEDGAAAPATEDAGAAGGFEA